MQLMNGRTPEQWAAYDRAKLIGAVALGLLLLVLSLAGYGPASAGSCCQPPAAAAVVPPPAAPTPDNGCAEELETDVLFATDSAELTPEGRATLDRLAPCWSHGHFEIEGHTDNTGTDAINQPLSERRAQAIVEELVKDGIDAASLTAKGYGSSRPLADNSTPEGRAHNRRVEFRKQ
jgi:outer membrane protein OmpA-like peptidoglycan-associated protein